jgi:hypothetical protein
LVEKARLIISRGLYGWREGRKLSAPGQAEDLNHGGNGDHIGRNMSAHESHECARIKKAVFFTNAHESRLVGNASV